MRGKIGAALGVAVPFVLLLVLAGGVWGADNTLCFDCHKDEALSKEGAGGKEMSLYVPEADFKASVHGKLSCSDCHTQITDDAHAAGGKQVKDHVECGVCHAKVDREYRQSLHAQPNMKGAGRAAYCSDCHEHHHAILSSSDPRSTMHLSNVAKTCSRCHSDKGFVKDHALGVGPTPGELFEGSIHGQSGEVTCTSCHGSHDARTLLDPQSSIFRSNIPHTCGACHAEITEQFVNSIHGIYAAKGMRDSPTCTTCHGFHGIKAKIDPDSPVNERRIAQTTCPQCHSAEPISRAYGITKVHVEAYYDSFHGLSYRGGDSFSANCASCHGVHDILPSSDPKSMIHRDNLQKTCGSCHPGASANFAKGKIHSVASIGGEEFGEKVVGWVRVVYIFLIVMTIGGMTFFNFTDWLRKTIDRKP